MREVKLGITSKNCFICYTIMSLTVSLKHMAVYCCLSTRSVAASLIKSVFQDSERVYIILQTLCRLDLKIV